MGAGVTRRRFVVGAGAAGLAGAGLLAGCGRWPGQAPVKQPAVVPRIGHLGSSTNPQLAEHLAALGYVDGQTIHIEWRADEGRAERLAQHVAELVNLNLDLILAAGTQRARALRDATGTIPIVMHSGVDPIGAGLAESLAHPGGNVTGAVEHHPELPGKQLELLREMVPGSTRVTALGSTASLDGARLEELLAAARILGLQLRILRVHTADALAEALPRLADEPMDGLLAVHSGLVASQQTRIIEFAARQRLPAMYGRRTYPESGGLAAYGPNLQDLFNSVTTHVDKILRGAKPADLPIEQPMRFDFVVNLKTARALGLTFPHEMLLQVTEVIE